MNDKIKTTNFNNECPICSGGPVYQDREDQKDGCAHCDDCGTTLSPDEFIILRKGQALSKALKAICLTRDYIGEDLLPPIVGWEWYDAGKLVADLIPNDEWSHQFYMRVNKYKDK